MKQRINNYLVWLILCCSMAAIIQSLNDMTTSICCRKRYAVEF